MFDFHTRRDENKKISKLEKLYQVYKEEMFNMAISILHNREDAQDVVQISIMKIYKTIASIEDIHANKAKSYIYTIVKNTALDLYRGKMKMKNTSYYNPELLSQATDEPTPEEIAIRMFDAEWLTEKLSEIHSDYADIIMLKYYHSLSDKEIAEMLNVSCSSVRVRLHRAKKALKQVIEKNNDAI